MAGRVLNKQLDAKLEEIMQVPTIQTHQKTTTNRKNASQH